MKEIFLLLFLLINYGCQQKTRVPPLDRPNVEESFYGEIRSYFSKRNYFKINASKISLSDKLGCHTLFCTNRSDCEFVDKNNSYCQSPKLVSSLYFSSTSYNSIQDWHIAEEKALKNTELVTDTFARSEKPGVTNLINIQNSIVKDKFTIEIIEYVLRHKEDYIMSDWLKSLNCRSMNFLAILKDPSHAKTKIFGKFHANGKRLFLEVVDSNNPTFIEADNSSAEMNYLTEAHFHLPFTLYTTYAIDFKKRKIPPLNFCESVYAF